MLNKSQTKEQIETNKDQNSTKHSSTVIQSEVGPVFIAPEIKKIQLVKE